MAYMCVKDSRAECDGCGFCGESGIVECEYCGDEIMGDSYKDDAYDMLCENCLLELHKN
jgi:hypothetical protein